MKKRNKLLSFLLALLIAVGALPVSAFAAQLPFEDVNPDDWYYDAVSYAYENGLFSGTGETTFSPDAPMTRAMFVTVLANRADNFVLKIYKNKSSFFDVEKTQWYAPAVEWASQFGLVSGVGDRVFAPNELVSREQMALILYNYAIRTENDTSIDESALTAFTDADTVSSWAREAMEWAATHGVVKGSDGKISPQNNARRCEVAQVWVNAKDVLVESRVQMPDPTPEDLPEGALTYQEFVEMFPNERKLHPNDIEVYPSINLDTPEVHARIKLTGIDILDSYAFTFMREIFDHYTIPDGKERVDLEFNLTPDPKKYYSMFLQYYFNRNEWYFETFIF